MNIIMAYYSKTGHTGRLAELIIGELKSRGHRVTVERIEPVKRRSKWVILGRQIHTYPLIALALLSDSFKEWWIERYPQLEEDIQPLSYPDVSDFDLVCMGGPKWAEICYPLARYLQQVRGLEHKPAAAFGTFGGPPFPVFELEMLLRPLSDRIEKRGAKVVAALGLSSGYHELYMRPVMKFACGVRFGRPLESFHFESDHGREKIEEFCDGIERAGERTIPRERGEMKNGEVG